jgi:hypothetical protein
MKGKPRGHLTDDSADVHARQPFIEAYFIVLSVTSLSPPFSFLASPLKGVEREIENEPFT